MSLINLASRSRNEILEQPPFDFKNHFPQAIVIKPNSQVCLNHFYHFRDDGYYRITADNNVIGFMISNFRTNSDYRYATLNTGRYVGTELAIEIAAAMNRALLQENYTWSCVFTEGNPNANPITEDLFTITYANVAKPAQSRGGEWTTLQNSSTKGLMTITNNNTDGQNSLLVNSTTERASVILDKGIRLHEGDATFLGFGLEGEGATFSQTIRPHISSCGLVRNAFSAANNINPNLNFSPFQGDINVDIGINVDDGQYKLIVSNLTQRRGTTSIQAQNGKFQAERRVLDADDLDGIFDETDKFGFQFLRTSATTQRGHDFVVRMLKSTDGTNYLEIADGVGGNNANDGRPNIYRQTINGVLYTSLIYTTTGIPDGAGGVVVNPRTGKTTASINRAIVKYAPFLPFCSLDKNNKSITGTELHNQLITLQTQAEDNDNTGAVADSVYVMKINNHTHHGFDYKLSVETAEAAALAGNSSVQANNLTLKQNPADPLEFFVYTNDATPYATATSIGDLTYDPYTGNGIFQFTLTSSFSLNPLSFKGTTVAVPKSATIQIECNGIFNSIGNKPTLSSGEVVNLTKHDGTTHDETLHVANADAVAGVALGADLPLASTLLLGRLTQDDISGNDTNPARLDGNTRGGSIGSTIGYGENVLQNDNATLNFVGNIAPIKLSGDDTLHISIPELTGVKSMEGENENIGKTIKVIPKSVFSKSDDSGALTYDANFEDWIDINNAETLYLNELTLQARKPDMTMATSLQPTTRASIKIREDPSKQAERQQSEMMEKMAAMMTQRQNTNTELKPLKLY